MECFAPGMEQKLPDVIILKQTSSSICQEWVFFTDRT